MRSHEPSPSLASHESRLCPPAAPEDTEGWFWMRTVGAPQDGDPRDGELRQSTREGATFAATQSRQNSLPSMSCITRHDSLSPSAGSSRTRTMCQMITIIAWATTMMAFFLAVWLR